MGAPSAPVFRGRALCRDPCWWVSSCTYYKAALTVLFFLNYVSGYMFLPPLAQVILIATLLVPPLALTGFYVALVILKKQPSPERRVFFWSHITDSALHSTLWFVLAISLYGVLHAYAPTFMTTFVGTLSHVMTGTSLNAINLRFVFVLWSLVAGGALIQMADELADVVAESIRVYLRRRALAAHANMHALRPMPEDYTPLVAEHKYAQDALHLKSKPVFTL